MTNPLETGMPVMRFMDGGLGIRGYLSAAMVGAGSCKMAIGRRMIGGFKYGVDVGWIRRLIGRDGA